MDLSEWNLRRHAAERACDMCVTAEEIKEALLNPEITRNAPPRFPRHQMMYVHGRIGLVVDPGTKEVITILWRTDSYFRRTVEEDLKRIRDPQ